MSRVAVLQEAPRVFDLADYAVLDGVSDDSAAIAAAVMDAGQVDGIVWHSGGTAGVASEIPLASRVTVASHAKDAATFKALAGLSNEMMFSLVGVDDVSSVDDVTFRDFTVDMNAVATSSAMKYRNTKRMLVDRILFKNSPYYYIHQVSSFLDGLTPLAEDLTVRDSEFKDHTGGTRECVIAAYVNRFSYYRNKSLNTHLVLNVYRAAFDTLISQSEFDTVTGSTPNAILYGRGCHGLTIDNNLIKAAGTTGSAAIRGCQPGDDYITNGGNAIAVLPDFLENMYLGHNTFLQCGVGYQIGAVKGLTEEFNLVQESLGTGALVNAGNTSANFAGYKSRELSWFKSKFLSNMKTAGTAALLFAQQVAQGADVSPHDLDAILRNLEFDDAGSTQTRSICFQGNNNAGQSVFMGADINESNLFTHPTTAIYQINSASGISQTPSGLFVPFTPGASGYGIGPAVAPPLPADMPVGVIRSRGRRR